MKPGPPSRTVPPAPPSIPAPRASIAPTGASQRPRKGRGRGRPTGQFTQHRRLDRLRFLLENNPRGLSLDDLAAMLHVTTRSVRRYLKELARLTELESVPIAPGSAHEWRIKPSERGRAITLRRTQAYGLMAPREVFEIFKGSALYDELAIGIDMLSSLAQRPTRAKSGGDIPVDQKLEHRFRYVPVPHKTYGGRGELLDELFRSVAESRETRMRLTSHMDEVFTAHPYALVAFKGELFCIAKRTETDRIEVHALDQIVEATPSEKKRYVVPADFDLGAWLHGEFGVAAPHSSERAVVEFDVTTAPEIRARKWHPAQRLATAPDGRVRLSFPLVRTDLVLSWVLGFGHHARVIEPPELVTRVRDELRRAADRYP